MTLNQKGGNFEKFQYMKNKIMFVGKHVGKIQFKFHI